QRAGADGRALGDDRRAGARDRRRLRDRGVRDGAGLWAVVDSAARPVRGDDDPRERHRPLDWRVSRRQLLEVPDEGQETFTRASPADTQPARYVGTPSIEDAHAAVAGISLDQPAPCELAAGSPLV